MSLLQIGDRLHAVTFANYLLHKATTQPTKLLFSFLAVKRVMRASQHSTCSSSPQRDFHFLRCEKNEKTQVNVNVRASTYSIFKIFSGEISPLGIGRNSDFTKKKEGDSRAGQRVAFQLLELEFNSCDWNCILKWECWIRFDSN